MAAAATHRMAARFMDECRSKIIHSYDFHLYLMSINYILTKVEIVVYINRKVYIFLVGLQEYYHRILCRL